MSVSETVYELWGLCICMSVIVCECCEILYVNVVGLCVCVCSVSICVNCEYVCEYMCAQEYFVSM